MRRVVMTKPIKLLALTLSTYADPDGSRIRPGNEALAAVTGDSEKNVRRILKVLREDFGLVQQVSRGGGRGGKGRAAEYRLTIPTDLLDRVVLLEPGDRASKPPDAHAADQSANTPDSQVSGQSGETATTGINPPDVQVSGGNTPAQPIDRTLDVQAERLTGHPGANEWTSERPTTTHRPATKDQPTTHLPAEPQTAGAHELDKDGLPEVSAAAVTPARCSHGLVIRRRPDGTLSCALCRRQVRETGAVSEKLTISAQNGGQK